MSSPEPVGEDDEGERSEDDLGIEDYAQSLNLTSNSESSESEAEVTQDKGKRKRVEYAELVWNEGDVDLSTLPKFLLIYTINAPIETVGPTARALDFLQLFFTDELLQLIVENTNTFAEVVIGKAMPLKPKSRLRYWNPTTIGEMKLFLGLCIFSGIYQLPRIDDYWGKSLYRNQAFPSVMSGNRFHLLSRMLHFSIQDTSSGDPLAKIRPVSEYLRKTFMATAYPGKQLSLDETMVAWRGRLEFRQYIKTKKHKYGIKVYKICTPDGYVLNFLPYVGKSTLESEVSKTSAIVKKLMKHYLGKGHEVFMDNYYNSVRLALELYDQQTLVVGTLRANRKQNPKVVLATKLKKGEVIWRRHGSVLVTKWKDKRDVLMISTKHNHQMTKSVNKRGEQREKPDCIMDYNKYMGGVDRSDQMASYNALLRRTKKWYKRFFFYWIQLFQMHSSLPKN